MWRERERGEREGERGERTGKGKEREVERGEGVRRKQYPDKSSFLSGDEVGISIAGDRNRLVLR